MLSFEDAPSRFVTSLQNWLSSNWCLARDESAYLARNRDLIGLATSKDSAINNLKAWIEDRLIWLNKRWQLVQNY